MEEPIMGHKVTIERLEGLRDAMIQATVKVQREHEAWSILTASKKTMEQSLRQGGATPTEAQEEFWRYMSAHEKAYSDSLQDLEVKRKEFAAAYREYKISIT